MNYPDLSAVVVVLAAVLDKREPVDVADVGLAVCPQQVEPADHLLECHANLNAKTNEIFLLI